jgi:F0F1-type ATP synthase membrane subunit a
MFAGHLLLKAFYSFIYILFFNITLTNAIFGIFVLAFTFFIIALEFLIAFLQAYVALLLIVLYISGVRTFSRAH